MAELGSELRREMAELRDELRREMAELRVGLRGEMVGLRDGLRGDMAGLHVDFANLRNELTLRMVAVVATATALLGTLITVNRSAGNWSDSQVPGPSGRDRSVQRLASR